MDYTGLTVLPQATSVQHGRLTGLFPSQSRAMSLLLTGLRENATTNNGESDFERLERERDLNSLFFWVTNCAKCSITRGLPCWASQVDRDLV